MTDLEVVQFMLPRVLVAIGCGVLIGLEREFKQKVAGMRTHMIVCVGSAIFVSISFVLVDAYDHFDPTRIIASTVSGVGFLGAGVIFKNDDKVFGITSAAFIWLTASLGALIGCGYIISGAAFTIGLVVFLIVVRKIEDIIEPKIAERRKRKKDADKDNAE